MLIITTNTSRYKLKPFVASINSRSKETNYEEVNFFKK